MRWSGHVVLKGETCIQGFGGQPWRGLLEDLRVDGKILLKRILKILAGTAWTESIWLWRTLENALMEHWVPYKWEISWLAEKISAIQESLYSMAPVVGTSWPASVKFECPSTTPVASMFVSLHGDLHTWCRHLLHCGRGQQDATCQKKENLHS